MSFHESVVIIFIFVGVMLFIGLPFLVHFLTKSNEKRNIRIEKGLKKAAHSVNGSLDYRSTNNWKLTLEIEGCSAVLIRSMVGAQITVRLPAPSFFQAQVNAGPAWLFSYHDIKTGDRKFDKMFNVQGTDTPHVQAFLTPALRRALIEARRRYGVARLGLTRSTLILFTQSIGEGDWPIVKFIGWVRTALNAHKEAVRGDESITFLDETEKRPDGVVCPICATPLGKPEDLVKCTRCETPHHGDCWNFFGGCSTFACGSKIARK